MTTITPIDQQNKLTSQNSAQWEKCKWKWRLFKVKYWKNNQDGHGVSLTHTTQFGFPEKKKIYYIPRRVETIQLFFSNFCFGFLVGFAFFFLSLQSCLIDTTDTHIINLLISFFFSYYLNLKLIYCCFSNFLHFTILPLLVLHSDGSIHY